MKIAILGGSFNPLHVGHAMLAETVIKEMGYDKVLFVPACIPPHKEIKDGATTAQRLEMVKVFCMSEKSGCFELEPCEVERGGVSYTYDTLLYICEKYKDLLTAKPGLIMGEEIAAEFNKWKNPEGIVELADLIIVPRKQDYLPAKAEVQNHKNKPTGLYNGDFNTVFNKEAFAWPCRVLSEAMLSVSSTEIRTRIAEGKSFKYLVPPAVFDYIENDGLYRNIRAD